MDVPELSCLRDDLDGLNGLDEKEGTSVDTAFGFSNIRWCDAGPAVDRGRSGLLRGGVLGGFEGDVDISCDCRDDASLFRRL